MPKFKVIKAHDGLMVGSVKTLPKTRLTDEMIANGWWVEVTETTRRSSSTNNRRTSAKNDNK